ncbi:peptide/nickel transport system substrate-binding protein [Amycolatopsis tolypomycina]|uniref:Peptide/nickel transport system substrate-binding protein n=1 Tax=Amycolatopsis tolypomycina TaxID=208445 RepID=A0A1H4ZCC6_9PSEU|nr:ABC transporter substrate-binding protein [Amycolatopsis tolypomycina]SED27134.1 peptide/nickel transport system substrate-binding protein [Amycolatopsis tolypomycina]
MKIAPRTARGVTAAAAALIASSTLVACSGGGAAGSQPINASQLVDSLPSAKADVDKITWNVTGEPDTLDPRNAVNYGSGQIVRNMCEGLLKMDAKFAISPNLATYQQVSPTELKLTIRDGVKFWDGTPLTAGDVAYSLQRSAAQDSVVSFGFTSVRDIAVTGAKEVTVSFKQPDSAFIGYLATVAGVVLEKAWAEKTGDQVGTSTGGLMCTGPYKFGSWRAGSGITIERNDQYWNTELKPKAKTVDFTFVSDDTALAQALGAGEIDGAYELPVSTLPKLTAAKTGRVVFGPSTQSTELLVARPDGPLRNQKLRDALQRAVDRDGIAKVVFNGAGQANYTELTPMTWPTAERAVYQPAYDQWVKARSYDVNAAKQLVKESSYDGSELVLAIQGGDEASSRVAQLFQQQASAIGVKIKIQTMQPLVFAQASYDATKRAGVDLLYTSNFNSQQNPLEPLGFDLLPGQPYNYTDFDDPAVTKLLGDARASFDPKQRAELIVQAQALYEPKSAMISLVSTNTATFLSNKLTGAVTSFAYWSMPQMAYVGAAQ